MSALPTSLNQSMRQEMVTAGLAVLNGTLTVEQAAAQNRMTFDQFLEAIEDPDIGQDIEALAARSTQNGGTAKALAHDLLLRALRQLTTAMEAADVTPAMALRVAELAHKVSGMATDRGPPPDEKPTFMIHIDTRDSSVRMGSIRAEKGVIDV